MKKIYWETKYSEGHFLPWVPLCEQHTYEQLSQPLSPSAANLTRRQFCDDLKFIFVESRHNFLSATNNKRLLFELVKSNLTHNNGPFLDTVEQTVCLLRVRFVHTEIFSPLCRLSSIVMQEQAMLAFKSKRFSISSYCLSNRKALLSKEYSSTSPVFRSFRCFGRVPFWESISRWTLGWR